MDEHWCTPYWDGWIAGVRAVIDRWHGKQVMGDVYKPGFSSTEPLAATDKPPVTSRISMMPLTTLIS